MMPPAWCAALAETMDAAPPVHPRVVRRIVERDLGVRIDDVFDEWDDEPVATASVAQVHRARVNGTTVAVKVGLGRRRRFSKDVDAMYRQAVLLKALKMDAGLDLPSVVAAYRELVKDEFDFRVELSKLDKFTQLIRDDLCGNLSGAPRHRRDVVAARWQPNSLVDFHTGDDAASASRQRRRRCAICVVRESSRANGSRARSY